MEVIYINGNQEKHFITIGIDEMKVTRIPYNGGRPMTIIKPVGIGYDFKATMKSIQNICEQDNEIYAMLEEHSNIG